MADIDRRRLNAALAEHLFGWHRTYSEFGELWTDGVSRNVVRCDETDFITWAGMELVIDAMQAKGWEFSLQMFSDAICWAKFATVNRQGYDYEEANTAPEAIGLAALRAVAPEVAAELEGEGAR